MARPRPRPSSTARCVALAGALIAAAVPGVARATYVGSQSTTVVGTLAAASPWIAVPQTGSYFNPGTIIDPADDHTSSLSLARVGGRGRALHFTRVDAPAAVASNSMGPMAVAASGGRMAVAWRDGVSGGRVHTASVSPEGALVDVVSVAAGAAGDPDVTLAINGTRVVSWTHADGPHAVLVPRRQSTGTALLPIGALGDDVLEPGGVVAVGETEAWVVSTGMGRVHARRLVVGQDGPAAPIDLGGAAATMSKDDGARGLWVLLDTAGGALVHVDARGTVRRTPLPATAKHPVFTVDGNSAVLAYQAGRGLDVFVRRVPEAGAPGRPVNLTRNAHRVRTPVGLAVDHLTATTSVLMRSDSGTRIGEVRRGRVRTWSPPGAQAAEAPVGILRLGSGRFAVQTQGSETVEDFGCGGSPEDASASTTIAVYRGTRRLAVGRLFSVQDNC